MKTLRTTAYILISSLVSVAACVSAQGQVTKIGDFVFDYTKVLLLDPDHDAMLVATTFRQDELQLVKISTGSVIESYPGRSNSILAIKDGYLISSSGGNTQKVYRRYYRQGSIETVLEDTFSGSAPWVGIQTVAPAIPGITGDWACTFSMEGLTLFDGESLIFQSVNSLSTFRGWTSAEGRLFAYFDEGFAELDPNGFEVLSEQLFPDSLSARIGLSHEEFVLLRNQASGNNEAGYKVANLLTGDVVDVLDENSLPESLPGRGMYDAVADGEYAVISHNIFTPYYLHFETYRSAVTRIHLPSAMGKYWKAEHTYRDVPIEIPLVHTEHGLMAFGNFKKTGIEPYRITSEGPEIVRDIHPGTARSIEIRTFHSQPLNDLLDFSYLPMTKGSASKGDKVYFVANHPQTGREVWVSDGSEKGTKLACEFYAGAGGVRNLYFAPSTDKNIYAVAGDDVTDMRLYRLHTQPGGMDIPTPQTDEWQRSFGLHDAHSALTRYGRRYDSKPQVASDGSVAVLYQNYYNRHPWMAFDANTYLNEDYGEYDSHAFSALQILNSDGSLRAMRRLSSRSVNVQMARHPDNGRMVIATGHRPDFTDYDGNILMQSTEGAHLLGLDSAGRLIWDKWLPGSALSIREIIFNDSGIFITGFFDKELNLGPEIPLLTAPDYRGFAARFDDKGTPIWSASMPEENANLAGYSGVIHKTHYDAYSDKLIVLEGGTGYGTSISCVSSEKSVHVASFDAQNGSRHWSHVWEVSDHIRPAGITSLPGGELWISGHTRGDIRIGETHLKTTGNYLNCTWNGFHALLNVRSGEPFKLISDEPEKAKFVFDIQSDRDIVHVASLIITEDLYSHPVTGGNSNIEIQIDSRDASGRMLAGETILTSARSSDVHSTIAHFKTALAHHPDYGNYLTVTNTLQGRIGTVQALSSQGINSASLLVLRRPAPVIDRNALDEYVPDGNDYLIYPNPTAQDGVYIQFQSDNTGGFNTARLHDISGRLVYSQGLMPDLLTNRIDLPGNLNNGLYVLRLEGPHGSLSEKLVIDR